MKLNVAAPDGLDVAAIQKFKSSKEFKFIEDSDWQKQQPELLIVRSATKVTLDLLGKLPSLRFVIRAGVGTDNIDFSACESTGVVVWNAPQGNFQSTAELAMGMIFSLFRVIPYATETTKSGLWKKSELSKNGRQVMGSTLGVLGLGNIGLRLARMANSIGMKVIAHDPYAKQSEFEIVSIEELFKKSNVVSVHLPMTSQTKGIVSRELLQGTPKGFFFVNTARGGLASEQDLLELLKNGHLGGVGLDVFEHEPVDLANPVIKELLSLPSVVVSPHIGAATVEAQSLVGQECFEKATRIYEDVLSKAEFRDKPLLLPKMLRSR